MGLGPALLCMVELTMLVPLLKTVVAAEELEDGAIKMRYVIKGVQDI